MNLIERIEQLAKIGPRVTGSPEEAIGKSMVVNWMLEDTTSEMCYNGTKVLTETIKRTHYDQ